MSLLAKSLQAPNCRSGFCRSSSRPNVAAAGIGFSAIQNDLLSVPAAVHRTNIHYPSQHHTMPAGFLVVFSEPGEQVSLEEYQGTLTYEPLNFHHHQLSQHRLVQQRTRSNTPQPPCLLPHRRPVLRGRLDQTRLASSVRRRRCVNLPARELHAPACEPQPARGGPCAQTRGLGSEDVSAPF